MRLLRFEMKRVIRSLLYWLVFAIFVISVRLQIEEDLSLQKPQPGQTDYGTKTVVEPAVVYPQIMEDLLLSASDNHFTAYPFGFYRAKTLDAQKLRILGNLILQQTGLDPDALLQKSDAERRQVWEDTRPDEAQLNTFLQQINSVIGMGSIYENKELFAQVGLTYEEANTEYEQIRQDGFSLAPARYFCDYAGIFLALLGWFVPLGVWYRDKNPAIRDTLHVRQVSTAACLSQDSFLPYCRFSWGFVSFFRIICCNSYACTAWIKLPF